MLARINARFAGNGGVLAKKHNAESRQHSDSRRTVAQALWMRPAMQKAFLEQDSDGLFGEILLRSDLDSLHAMEPLRF